MDYEKWKALCSELSEESLGLMAIAENDELFGTEGRVCRNNGSICFPPATDADIASVEAALGCNLPGSYKEFLRFSDGMILLSMNPDGGRLLPVKQIGLYRDLYPEKFRIFKEIDVRATDAQYFVYGSNQDPVFYRSAYADSLIAVSTHFSSVVFLLNPEVIFEDGEWEAWLFNFHGGADRYRSFYELMFSEKGKMMFSLREMIFAED